MADRLLESFCEWVLNAGIYECPRCGQTTRHATTQKTCRRQLRENENSESPAMKIIGPKVCIHLGEPTGNRLKCGCPNQSPYKIHLCNLFDAECAEIVDNAKLNPGVLCCTRCKRKAYM